MEALTHRSAGALVFVGFMGAGKSSAAQAVAAELAVEPIDCDAELERELGAPIEEFFEHEGLLAAPELGLALAVEERLDRLAQAVLEQAVGVVRGLPEDRADRPRRVRFAGPHEAHEDQRTARGGDVVGGVSPRRAQRLHPIRSR